MSRHPSPPPPSSPPPRRRFFAGFAALAVLGATLGSALDAIHSHFGATSYARPIFAKAAWWVPLLFAGAYASAIARPLMNRDPAPSGRRVALGMALFIGAYWMSVARIPWQARTAVIAILFAAGYWFCDRTRSCLIVAAIAGVCGPVVEMILVSAGAFVHHEVHVLGVPWWLPFLYFSAAPGLGSLAKWIVDGGREISPAEAQPSPLRRSGPP